MTPIKNPATGRDGEADNQRTEQIDYTAENQKSPFNPVIKLQWLRQVVADPNNTRAVLAVCIVLADMSNSASGISWPSYKYLSDATKITPRGVKMAIKSAIQTGAISVAEPGTRTKSNRYKINLALLGSEPQFTTLLSGSEPQFTSEVVNHSSSCSEPQRHHVVNHSSPESIYLSEQQAKDRIDISQADGVALSLRPCRPTLARRPCQNSYDEFWTAVGKRATVAESEQIIERLVGDGVPLEDIVNGAKRWRLYNEATGGRRATSPAKWLEKEKWRDDWTLPNIKPKATNNSTTKATKSKSPVGSKKTTNKPKRLTRKELAALNREFVDWESRLSLVIEREQHKHRDSRSEECQQAVKNCAIEFIAKNPEPDSFCYLTGNKEPKKYDGLKR